MNTVYTQDYQEVEFQMELNGCEYNMFTLKVVPKVHTSIGEAINEILPYEVRLIILRFLREILTYSETKLPRQLIFELFSRQQEEINEWARRAVSHNNTGYPLCRGFCLNCGESAQALRCVDKTKRFDKRWKYKLPVYGLALMGVCYYCMCMGYNYNKDNRTVTMPDTIRSKDRKLFYPTSNVSEHLYGLFAHNPN